jgi:D-alanyl-D-alanine dipeptidase
MKLIKIISILFILSCGTNINNKEEKRENSTTIYEVVKDSVKTNTLNSQKTSTLELHLLSFGLVDIQNIEPKIKINLKYSTKDNFVGIDLYGELEKVFLQPDVAQKLKIAQQYLQKIDSNLNLLVFDGVRPLHIQQLMWDTLKMPIHEKTKFLSNPKNRSIHNYGAAIDLSIITKNGEELDMGTPYDFIGELAYPRKEQEMLENGKLTQKQAENRTLLRKVMKKAGFSGITTEWWHFNSCSRNTAKQKYKLVL